MKSFLKEIEDKFFELEQDSDMISPDNELGDEDELDEISATGGVAGFNTPAAFAKPGQWKNKKLGYASGVNESTKSVSKTYKPGEYQTVEFDEEVQNDKFPFAINHDIWWNKDMEYPSKDITNSPGTAHKKDHDAKTRKSKLKVEDVIEQKYEQLVENYRNFKSEDVKPSVKVKKTIQEIAKKLSEIETLVNYNSKLKTESGVTSTSYGPSTTKALTKISERLIKISEKIRSLGE
jgi:hypothetical protein